jgi:hypothetical protein
METLTLVDDLTSSSIVFRLFWSLSIFLCSFALQTPYETIERLTQTIVTHPWLRENSIDEMPRVA